MVQVVLVLSSLFFNLSCISFPEEITGTAPDRSQIQLHIPFGPKGQLSFIIDNCHIVQLRCFDEDEGGFSLSENEALEMKRLINDVWSRVESGTYYLDAKVHIPCKLVLIKNGCRREYYIVNLWNSEMSESPLPLTHMLVAVSGLVPW